MKGLKFLIIEDDELARIGLSHTLSAHGEVTETAHRDDALKAIENGQFDMVFIDLDLDQELEGLDIIAPAKAKGSHTVVLSGREEDVAVMEAYSRGCDDYLTKPFNQDALTLVLKRYEILQNQGRLKDFFALKFVTADQEMIDQLQVLNEIAVSDRPIFLSGPTGTGKTFMAKLIHQMVGTEGKFIHLNCSEIPENLMESELFGHKKGAFSGATNDKKGKLELADEGTLFLDEIATMPDFLQKKLLKSIEEKTFYPLGSEKEFTSNFRLISATCEDLVGLVKEGKFREDLYYRIEGFNIHLKSLKERMVDLALLTKHFLREGTRRVVFNEEVWEKFKEYSWPGNVRELKKVIDLLRHKEKGIIQLSDLPSRFTEKISEINWGDDGALLGAKHIEFIKENGLKAMVEEMEGLAVQKFYEENGQKVRQTLQTLKISNSSFYRIMDHIKKSEGEDS